MNDDMLRGGRGEWGCGSWSVDGFRGRRYGRVRWVLWWWYVSILGRKRG